MPDVLRWSNWGGRMSWNHANEGSGSHVMYHPVVGITVFLSEDSNGWLDVSYRL